MWPSFRGLLFNLFQIPPLRRASPLVRIASMSYTRGAVNRDPSTQSNYDQFRTKYVCTEFDVDFSRRRLSGEVQLRLEVLAKSKEIVLDSSYLDLKAVTVNQTKAKWTLGARHEALGSPLCIHLDQDAEVGKELDVRVCLHDRIERGATAAEPDPDSAVDYSAMYGATVADAPANFQQEAFLHVYAKTLYPRGPLHC